MKCSNPNCNRGIGLVSHRRVFGKRHYCSRKCRDTFVADLTKVSLQQESAMTFFEWLFSQPVGKSRNRLVPAAIRRKVR
jgi:hypothetical protein